MINAQQPGRRRFLQAATLLAGTGLLSGLARPARAAFGDATSTLLVGGPEGSLADRWSGLIAAALDQMQGGAAHLRRTLAGGLDGVTAANQLAWQTTPDGNTAALLPAAAGRAWLAGDPRVHFDAANWVPLFAALVSGALVCAAGLDPRPGTRLRVAADSPAGASLPGLLGLTQLGIVPVPQFGRNQTAALQDVLTGNADACLLSGADLPARLAALPGSARPVFSLGALDVDGNLVRDPALPDLPHLPELLARAGRPVPPAQLGAWRAAAAATRLEVALVLPPMTPAASVARWRQICTQLGSAPGLQLEPGGAMRLAGPPEAVSAINDLAADQSSLLELRRFLGERLGYTPA